MNVLIADKFEHEGIEAIRGLGCTVRVDPELGPESLPSAMREFTPEILVVRSTKVPGGVVESASTVRGIIRAGAGYDNIDTDAASARNIAVCNCPGMNSDAVAELTIGLLIACDRRICEQDRDLEAGHWNKAEYSKACGLKGRRLLVIGTGAIGLGVVRRAMAFGMEVFVQSRSLTAKWARELGVGLVGPTREDLLDSLGDADAVSIHVPLSDDTRGLCNADFFGRMKPGSIFVNTSRGAVVDESALAEAVRSRGLRAGLDVYNDQPSGKQADWKPEIAGIQGVVTTHHVGASTDQAQLAVAQETVRIIRVYQQTGRFENRVN